LNEVSKELLEESTAVLNWALSLYIYIHI